MLFAVAALFIAAIWAFRAYTESQPSVDPDFESGSRLSATFVPTDELDRLVAAYELRTGETETPSNYIILGQLYLEKARVTGDLSRYLQAEAAFRRGIELRPNDPIPAVGLAQTDLALHRFSSALERVDGIARLDAVAVAVDAQIAIGRIDDAERSLDILAVGAEGAGPILVRRAELAWMRGQVEEAKRLAEAAVNPLDANLARRAWYQTFAAQMAFQTGDHVRALELAEAAFGNDPESIGAQGVLARASYATGDLERAETMLGDATSPVPDPTFLDELGDVQTMRGDQDAADATYATIGVIATLSEASEAYDRSVARSLSDRGVETSRAVGIAEGELDVRRDALTLDTLAWALFRDGQIERAKEFSDEAVATGIREASVLYHAAEIAAASGDEARASELVRSALDMNDFFDLLLRRDAMDLAAEVGS